MNKRQQEYVMNQLEKIAREKIYALSSKHKPVDLSPEQMVKALLAGDFTINKKGDRLYYCDNSASIIQFNAEKNNGTLEKQFAADKKKVWEEVNRIERELVLGDSKDALELIKAFEKFSV